VLAWEKARLCHHNFLGPGHLLLGLIVEGEGIAAQARENLGGSLEAARDRVEGAIGPAGSTTRGSPPFTPQAKKAFELARPEALPLGHSCVGTEHIPLGLAREGEGVPAEVLAILGTDLSRLCAEVIKLSVANPGGKAKKARAEFPGERTSR